MATGPKKQTRRKPQKKQPKGEVREYASIRFLQRGKAGPELVIFSAPAGEILEWAEVMELGPKKTNRGPQREQSEARVSAIAKFLSANARNTIPTAVVLAFEKGKASFVQSKSDRIGTLSVDTTAGYAASVVDGQHRLAGARAFEPSTEIAVVGLLAANAVERAFQFLVINNKASKVAATHAKALLAKMDGTNLAERLKGARLAFDVQGIRDVDLVNSESDSPFYQTIDWSTTPSAKRMVQATSIELSLDYLDGLGIPEYADRDTRRSVFLIMWKAIRARWGDLWVRDSRLVSKVGIVCLTRFVADLITSWADSDELDIEVTDLEQIEEQTGKIVGYMDPRFWTAPWSEKAQGGFDTNQGRERVIAALTHLYRNGRRGIEWYTDIEIIERAATDG